MIVSQDLKRMLPDWYEGLYETNLLMTIEQSLIDDLAVQINRAQSNLYISTADSETLAVYENMLRITRQNGDTLDMCRFRILTRLASQKPYTMRYLEELLSSLVTKWPWKTSITNTESSSTATLKNKVK